MSLSKTVLLLALAACLAAPSATAEEIEVLRGVGKERPSPGNLIALIRDNGHFAAEAVVNGRDRVKLLVDTGASAVVLTRAAADRIGLKTKNSVPVEMHLADGRRVKAQGVILDRLKVGNMEAEKVEAIVLPESDAVAFMSDGLLGMSFLRRYQFAIDTENEKLLLKEK